MFKWRRTSQLVLTLALVLTTLGSDALFSQGRAPARRTVMIDGREVVEGEVLVRYRSQSGTIERERAEFQANSDASEAIGRSGARRLRSRGQTTQQMLAALRANPDVEIVEPNYIIRASATPNDPSFGALWGLLNTGQNVDGQPGVAGADINATAAWDVTTGSRANVVAIIDSGIDWTHPDLAANMFTAPTQFSVQVGSQTITCAAGTHGFNALNNTCNPVDDNGHGTHVAGIVGAVGNNGVGVTGVNWVASLMALKVLGIDGTGTTSDAIKAIEFAIKTKTALGANANVRVLNASWGGSNFSQLLSEQIEAANAADMLFVAAAGSDGSDNDALPHYPASYSGANVVSVAAVDNTGQLATFSNYGATTVDLAAPGTSTYSTFPGNTYGDLSGTSMAAPHVAGAAALVLSACPINTATLKSTLLSTVVPDPSLSGMTVSGGRLDMHAALRACAPGNATLTLTSTTVAPGAMIEAALTNDLPRRTDWVGLYPIGAADGAFLDWTYLNNTKTAPASPIGSATITLPAPATAGTYQLRYFTNGYTRLATSSDITVVVAPSLSINDVTVTEGNSGTTTATFTVTLSRSHSATVNVAYATANGSATAGSDYTAASGTLNFPPSTVTQQFSVTIAGDTTTEATENFFVNLTSPINATIADAQGVGTITTDDAAGTPSMTVSNPTVAPGGTVNAVIANGPGLPRDWIALYVPGAADSAFQDWWYLNGQKTAPVSGMADGTVQLPAPTALGSYELRLFTNGYNRVASANFTVATAPSLSINDVTVTEGNSGTVNATFTVTLSSASSQTVTVAYATASSSATSGTDFVGASGTLTFTPSTLTQTITVTVNGDTTIEPTESFVVNLSGATNAAITDNQGVGTITTDDGAPSPSMTVSNSPVAPGSQMSVVISNGSGNSRDWVALYNPTDPDGSFMDWWYLNGQKTAPTTGVSNTTLQLPAPNTTGTYQLRWFTNGYNRVATANLVVASMPTLSINDVAVTEGNSGTTTATFTVTLSTASSSTITVNYATADGSALSASDYAANSGTLTFTPSTTTRTVSVTINGDTTIEPSESFFVNLSSASNASINDSQGVGTITTDDAAPSPSISIGSTTVAPGGMIDVTINNPTGNAKDWIGVYVPSAADGSFSDWFYLNGQKTAPAVGPTGSANFQIPAPATEGSYQLRLFTNGYTKLATSATITVSTVASVPSFSINDVTVNEGNSGTTTATFTVTLSRASSDTLTVSYATANGTAASPGDYVAASGTLTFAPSVTTQTFTVAVNGDTTAEANENFVVNLSNASSSAAISDSQGVGTIINDDGSTSPSLTVNTPTVTRGGMIEVVVSNGTGNARDWLGVYNPSADDYSFVDWWYLNGQKTAPATGQANVTVQFTAPTTAGTYNVRMFTNGYNKLATSATITVTP